MAEFRPHSMIAHLVAYGVDFVVVGGIAATIHGGSRLTFDLDICPAGDPDNLDRLGRALIDLDARLRGVEEEVPFVPDARTLRGVRLLTMTTRFGSLDVLMRPDGSPPYKQLRNHATRLTLGTTAALVASIEDLIEMKLAAGRSKDTEDVEQLEAIRRLERRLRREAR